MEKNKEETLLNPEKPLTLEMAQRFMEKYANYFEVKRNLKPEGKMILSGFYLQDIPALAEAAEQQGLSLKKTEKEDEWAMLLFEANALGGRNV
jgi:hypothetical protein